VRLSRFQHPPRKQKRRSLAGRRFISSGVCGSHARERREERLQINGCDDGSLAVFSGDKFALFDSVVNAIPSEAGYLGSFVDPIPDLA
jgi:hypothetical protein